MRLVLIGPPGAGKGTQAERISLKFRMPRITTGDLLREAIQKETPLGKKANGYVSKGNLVPDAVILDLMGERMNAPDAERGWILDGFPRTLVQAEGLDRWLKEKKQKIDRVIALEVTAENLVARLSGRRQCKRCGAAYHLVFHPPRQKGICDRCQGELFQREDDKESTVRHRLEVYEKQTRPIADYYAEQGLLKTVNGEKKPEEVFNMLSSLITDIQ